MGSINLTWNSFWHEFLKRPYRLSRTLDSGSNGQLIIFIHGLGSTASSWLPAARQFDPSRYRLVGYDLLGFGSSPKPTNVNYTVDEHAKALTYTIKKDFGGRPMILVAHSMGCIITSRLASASKLQIQRCLLYQPPLLSISNYDRRNIRANIYNFFAGRPNLVLTYSNLISRRAGRLRAFAVRPETWLAFERSLKNTILSQSALEELRQTPIPTDIIYGRFDFVVSRKQAKNLIADNPNIMLHTVAEMHDISPRAGRYIKKILEE